MNQDNILQIQDAIEDFEDAIRMLATDYISISSVEIAMKALKKQIPKKPYLINFKKTTIAYCPSCGNSFGELKPVPCIYIALKLSDYNNHQAIACDCCGQALDWSVEE